nr:hypothetical protein TQ38_16185 [Novosphingobium sp. P6W]
MDNPGVHRQIMQAEAARTWKVAIKHSFKKTVCGRVKRSIADLNMRYPLWRECGNVRPAPAAADNMQSIGAKPHIWTKCFDMSQRVVHRGNRGERIGLDDRPCSNFPADLDHALQRSSEAYRRVVHPENINRSAKFSGQRRPPFQRFPVRVAVKKAGFGDA